MSKIKSAKAKSHIEKWQWQSKGGTFDNSPIILRSIAAEGIIIAETEAEERHAKALQELKDKAVETFRRCCKYKHDWFCSDLDNRTENGECDSNCNYMQNFTQKLNEL